MDKRYVTLLIRRWWWLLLLAALVAAAATYAAGVRQPPVYQASVRLIVGPGIDSPSPDLNDLRAGGQLMQTYAELPHTEPFLEAVIAELGLDMTAAELSRVIEVRSNQETQILTINTHLRDAFQAIALANAVADNLVRISPSGMETPAALLNQRISQQATRLETSIGDMEARIAELEAAVDTASPAELPDLLNLLWQERAQLTESHNTLAGMYDALQETATNQVKIIEPAGTARPILTTLWLRVAIGAAAGLVLSAGLALGYEYLSDTVDPARDLTQALDVPVLGAVVRHQPLRGSGRERLVVEAMPNSPAAESYRKLGIKLLFAHNEEQPVRSILLTSISPQEDVGEIAANLAVVLAQMGSRVVLIDANLYRPTIGQLFGIVNRCGLTDVLTGECRSLDLTAVDWAPGLSVLPSGSVTYNSFMLLASPQMLEVMQQLAGRADIVLIAGSPPVLFADSLFLASRVDGVVLLGRSGQTRRSMLHETVSSVRAVGANLLGAIFHDARPESRLLERQNGRADQPVRPALPVAEESPDGDDVVVDEAEPVYRPVDE